MSNIKTTHICIHRGIACNCGPNSCVLGNDDLWSKESATITPVGRRSFYADTFRTCDPRPYPFWPLAFAVAIISALLAGLLLFANHARADTITLSGVEPNDWYSAFDASPIRVVGGTFSPGPGPFGDFHAGSPIEILFTPTRELNLDFAFRDPRFSPIIGVTWNFDSVTSELRFNPLPFDLFIAVPHYQPGESAAPTPEISTWAMISAGLASMFLFKRRIKKCQI